MNRNKLNEEVKYIWNENAPFWDNKIGPEGNDFHRILVEPAQLKLLELKKGDLILDIACGNGQFSRKMSSLGAKVIAFDLSEKFIQIAKEHSSGYDIEYSVLDATDREELLKLGERRFDKAVATMAIMDMADIEPLVKVLTILLKKGSSFVFSLCHPCFNSARIKRVQEEEDINGEMVRTGSLMVYEYNTSSARKGIGIEGQPLPHYYFHRTMTELFSIFFQHGFVLYGMEEPVFPPGSLKTNNLFWKIHSEIPPVLIAGMKLI